MAQNVNNSIPDKPNSIIMELKNSTRKLLDAALNRIRQDGIQADRLRMKQNMYTQFSDPFEFAREYVVNSYDAMATACFISGRETRNTVTVTIRDNGRGMDQQRLQDYFKIFRSRKDNSEIKAIGHFGVGKMSVAAVPDLLRFAGITSTGAECWRFETDSLINDKPVTLERIEPVPEKGTKFEITFKKNLTLSELLVRIFEILYKYVRHLDIDIYFDLTELDKDNNPVRKKLPRGNWLFDPDNFGKSYQIFSDGVPVEIIMGVGNAGHEIYQNRVFITSKYNLISFGAKDVIIPNLEIRADSEAFQLTFGRHCLSDEKILYTISDEITDYILPQYFEYLRSLLTEDFIVKSPDLVEKMEEMACGLIEFRAGDHSWNSFPLFRTYGRPRLSFSDLSKEVEESGVLYAEAKDNEGTDYSMFNGPVLMTEQPQGGMEVIQKMFAAHFVNLNHADVVIEAPLGSTKAISPEEKHFERFLVFKPRNEILEKILGTLHQEKNVISGFSREQMAKLEDAAGICEEAKIVERDFNLIIWKVNYLVERDGKTPCRSRRFLYTENKIILNLYHPDIRQFVDLSCMSPGLSAHWALAMCLSDMKLLSYITPDAREDLLLIDAMGRLDSTFPVPSAAEEKKRMSLLDFLRDIK
jgi:hypothetical protein